MSVHVYPARDDRHRIKNDGVCWCRPRIDHADPKTGEPYTRPIVVHHAFKGYRDRDDAWAVVTLEDDGTSCDPPPT